MKLGTIRSSLYTLARLLGDILAASKGPAPLAKRIERRVAGRIAGRVLRGVANARYRN